MGGGVATAELTQAEPRETPWTSEGPSSCWITRDERLSRNLSYCLSFVLQLFKAFFFFFFFLLVLFHIHITLAITGLFFHRN